MEGSKGHVVAAEKKKAKKVSSQHFAFCSGHTDVTFRTASGMRANTLRTEDLFDKSSSSLATIIYTFFSKH